MAYKSDAQYSAMVQAASQDLVLNEVMQNPASSDIITKLFRGVAEAGQSVYDYLEAAKKEILQQAQRAKPHTAGWSCDRIKEFRWDAANQRGYSYSLDNTGFVDYTAGGDDLNAEIITAATVDESFGIATMKTAKGTPGNLQPLTSDELLAAKQYMNDRIRACGQRMTIVSRAADSVRVSGSIYVNALYGTTTVATAVVNALAAYVSTLDFGGKINKNKVIDTIQQVEGVIDCDLILVEYKPSPVNTYRTVTREAALYAGYAVYTGSTSNFNIIPA